MIHIQALSKTYDTPAGAFPALRNIDLEIAAGEFVAIVGKSGSGKSTLLNMVGGIDRPSSGSLRVGGRTIQGRTHSELASWRGPTVGFVFQFFQLPADADGRRTDVHPQRVRFPHVPVCSRRLAAARPHPRRAEQLLPSPAFRSTGCQGGNCV